MHAKVKDNRFWTHFKGAIGAIDGSHVPVSVPGEEVVNHTCRHGYTSQNVLAVCDFDMRFTFVVAGWPGSTHDTRVLNHALTKFADQFPVPPKGRTMSFYLKCSVHVASFILFLVLTYLFFQTNTILWIPVIQTGRDTLLLLKGVHIIYQNFVFVGSVHLKGSLRYIIFCIHPFAM